ncbi:MAG: 30S ribosomal protein S16 [Chlamydiota bacterium]
MALMIRLRQQGRTNRQTYRLVVTDKKNPRDGKYIEMLGWYNPHEENEKNLFIDADKVQLWLDKGAIMTPKAHALVKQSSPDLVKGLLEKKLTKKLRLKGKKKKA